VCFRRRAGDAFNESLMNRLNESGALYLTHTMLDDRFVLRLAVGSSATRGAAAGYRAPPSAGWLPNVRD